MKIIKYHSVLMNPFNIVDLILSSHDVLQTV